MRFFPQKPIFYLAVACPAADLAIALTTVFPGAPHVPQCTRTEVTRVAYRHALVLQQRIFTLVQPASSRSA